jgi:hypothetical protein
MYSTDPQVIHRLTSPSNNAGVFATSRSNTGLGSNHFSSGASTGRTVMSSASSHTSTAADRTVSVSVIIKGFLIKAQISGWCITSSMEVRSYLYVALTLHLHPTPLPFFSSLNASLIVFAHNIMPLSLQKELIV